MIDLAIAAGPMQDVLDAIGPMQQQAQAVDPVFTVSSSHVSPVVFWGTVMSPLIAATILTSVMILALKRANRKDGNEPISAMRLLIAYMLAGAIFGGVSQWAMQELVEYLTAFSANYKMVIFAAMSAGIAAMLLTQFLLWWSRRMKWDRLYRFILVEHVKGVDYTRVTDWEQTIVTNPESEDKTEPQADGDPSRENCKQR